MKKTTLAINFWAQEITEENCMDFMKAIEHENADMSVQMLNESIARLDKKIANENDTYTEEEVQAFSAQKVELEKAAEKFEETKSNTLEVYTKVVNDMGKKNENGFGNHKDVVRTVLRVLATWNNSKLVKYAIIPAFQSPALYEALEAIHITSKASEDGATVMTKEVKEAYKNASKELESIIKNTFSLPFATMYTDKTRVKMDAEDKKLLNESYVKGFRNKFVEDEDTGVVTFKKRQINTLVKTRKNKKTGEVSVDYSGLATVLCNIVIKHYFA